MSNYLTLDKGKHHQKGECPRVESHSLYCLKVRKAPVVRSGAQRRLTYLSFAVQGGNSQTQNRLYFILGMVEFDMSVWEAVEAAEINSFQLRGSFGEHENPPPACCCMMECQTERTGSCASWQLYRRSVARVCLITAIYFDREQEPWGTGPVTMARITA